MRHLRYGKVYLSNIDSFQDVWIEHDYKSVLAWCEFKNEGENIDHASLAPVIKDAEVLQRPFYISVCHVRPKDKGWNVRDFSPEDYPDDYIWFYYLIPLSSAAKKCWGLETARWFTEADYITFLAKLRNKELSTKALLEQGFTHCLPKVLPIVNI